MKATIEFNDDEKEDLQTALDGYKWKLLVWDLNQKLRTYMKYDETITEEQYEIVEKIKKDLYELLNDYNLNLD
jgi:hypothetical protein